MITILAIIGALTLSTVVSLATLTVCVAAGRRRPHPPAQPGDGGDLIDLDEHRDRRAS